MQSPPLVVVKQEQSPLFFLSEREAWVGTNGIVYHTSDGGARWQAIYRARDATDTIEAFFITERVGWLAVNNWSGTHYHFILKTPNGGATWQQLLNLESPIFTIFLIDKDIGFVRDRWDALRKTTDGGKTWTKLEFPHDDKWLGLFEGLRSVFFFNPNSGWAYGTHVWRTTDEGNTWHESVSVEQVNGVLYSASFVDENHGWIVGTHRQLWCMTDGKTWQHVTNIPAAQGPPDEITHELPSNFNSVSFINAQEGWIAADDRTILHSTDGGASWSVVAVLANSARALRFLSEKNGWALDTEGQLLHTLDGGHTWNVQPLL